jgi:hypothetical protein
LNIKTTQCDGKAREFTEADIGQKYGLGRYGTPQFDQSFAKPVKKDSDPSIIFIKSPARHGSPGQELDAPPDSGPQIDLTINLKKGPTVKGKSPIARGISKEKKQQAGIVKKPQAESTNPNLTNTENFGKPAPRLIDTEAKKLAIENPEAKQNKAKIIKVSKSQNKRGLNLARDENPIPYYYYHYYSKTIFRDSDAKLPTAHGKFAERCFDGKQKKLESSYFSPQAKEADLEVRSNNLDDDSWGDSEYDFGDSPIESTEKALGAENDGADGMNSVSVPDIG